MKNQLADKMPVATDDLWCELTESQEELVKGGTVLAVWKNWQYTAESGWGCQPGKVC